jgi:hypothetical protein
MAMTDRDASAGGLYTFEPEVFAITELDPGGDGPARTAVEGTIFHGHFERGGSPIAEHVTAEVRCFGRAGQLHLATGSHGFAGRLTVGGEVYLELAELGS